MALLYRAARNPGKYFRPSFWRMMRHVMVSKVRAQVFFAPAQWVRRLRRERPLRIYVFPARLDKYQFAELYVAWKVLRFCNMDVTATAENADIALAWEPSTQYVPDRALIDSLQTRMHVINARCTDIRKSFVDRILRETFGYSLAVDPRTHHGTLLRKSEKNGAHDAVLLEAPFEPQDGFVYQRLVTPAALRKGLPDYRTFIVAGEAVAVNRNYHPVEDRFQILPNAAEVIPLNEAFTPAELAAIRAFNERIGLEFGVLDIMRDRDDGRIYIMDCNNTPTGPTRKLSIREQIGVTRIVADAFERAYLSALRPKRSSIVGELPSRAEETLLRR